eukprot:Hpha_TRINITY_DN14804_c0_g4::TRINITY_DN14804_c0_g4_i1::g.169366::m.169366
MEECSGAMEVSDPRLLALLAHHRRVPVTMRTLSPPPTNPSTLTMLQRGAQQSILRGQQLAKLRNQVDKEIAELNTAHSSILAQLTDLSPSRISQQSPPPAAPAADVSVISGVALSSSDTRGASRGLANCPTDQNALYANTAYNVQWLLDTAAGLPSAPVSPRHVALPCQASPAASLPASDMDSLLGNLGHPGPSPDPAGHFRLQQHQSTVLAGGASARTVPTADSVSGTGWRPDATPASRPPIKPQDAFTELSAPAAPCSEPRQQPQVTRITRGCGSTLSAGALLRVNHNIRGDKSQSQILTTTMDSTISQQNETSAHDDTSSSPGVTPINHTSASEPPQLHPAVPAAVAAAVFTSAACFLPTDWEVRAGPDGVFFYFNGVTLRAQWERPEGLPWHGRKVWHQAKASSGQYFYFCKETGEKQWEYPDAANEVGNCLVLTAETNIAKRR